MLEACNFIKETLKHRCFSVIFVKRLGTPILKNIRGCCFYRGINRTLSNISDENFFANSSFLTGFLTIFSKKHRYRYLTGSWIGFRIVLQNNSNKISGSSQENTYGEAPCRPYISNFATFLSSWFYHGYFPRNAEVFKDTTERLILRFSDILIWISVYMRVLFWPQSFFLTMFWLILYKDKFQNTWLKRN